MRNCRSRCLNKGRGRSRGFNKCRGGGREVDRGRCRSRSFNSKLGRLLHRLR